ncbi:MAG: hypothetical protein RL559_1554 [Pseudomonadota bacterium]|jgi:uncharacterized membrane protein YfcA
MLIFLLSAAVVLLASVLHAATGFGFSILAVPLLLLLHAPWQAVQINLILSIALSLMLIPATWAQVDRRLLWRLLPSSALGAPLGLLLFLHGNADTFKTAIALLILLLTGLLAWRLRFARSPWRDALSGLLAGGMTSAVGMGGVPLLVYFAGVDMPKATARATVLAFFTFIYSLALALQVHFSAHPLQDGWLTAGLLPVALLGVAIGKRLYLHLSQRVFSWAIYTVLLGNSAFLLASVFRGTGP